MSNDVMDHRRLGRELGLFASDDMLGAGLPMWLPAGAVVRAQLEAFVLDLERRAGYQHVYTPPLAKRELYERSGHWAHFQEGMFPPIAMGGDELVLRPMNCPHHMRVFAVGERSYRELPLRIAELGAMFRNELSGTLGGLSRVRGMTLNDAHIFCTPEQVDAELDVVIGMMQVAHAVLDVDVHEYRLSLRGDDDKYAGDRASWDGAEDALRRALGRAGIDFVAEEGEAAFYGPKLDVQVLDALGREETLSTIQVDAVLPQRLGVSYVGDDGSDHAPVVIHRSLISTMERMVAYLIERHQGALPVWLAPVQIALLAVADEWEPAARALSDDARAAGLRVDCLPARQTLNARIREAAIRKIPYVVVLGEREAAGGQLSIRRRDGSAFEVPAAEFISRVAQESADRS